MRGADDGAEGSASSWWFGWELFLTSTEVSGALSIFTPFSRLAIKVFARSSKPKLLAPLNASSERV